jgi:hypothetical protein
MTQNESVILEIKAIIAEGGSLEADTRDRLLLSAIIDIYEQLDRLQPALTFYKAGLYFASALGLSVLALLWGLLTGQVVLVFR